MKHQLLLITAFLAACTYGPAEDHVTVQNLALKPDGSQLAVMVKYERYQVATGLTAFPDGGVPRVLVKRTDLYVMDLPSRALVDSGQLLARPAHRIAFSPWLLGWVGDTVYFQVTGCAGTPGDECHGALINTSLFGLPPGGTIAEAALDSLKPELTSSITRPGHYLSVAKEPYGVSLSQARGEARRPLMRFVGVRLEVVSAGVPGAL